MMTKCLQKCRCIDVLTFLYFVMFNSQTAKGLTITAASEVGVINGDTLTLEWDLIQSPGDKIDNLRVYVLPDTKNEILTLLGNNPTQSEKAIEMFGANRLSATFNESKYEMILTNIRMNESGVYQLYATYENGQFFERRLNIKVGVTAADVTTSTPVLEATYGTTVNMQWKISLDSNQIISYIKVILESQRGDLIVYGGVNSQNVQPKGKELFGNRLFAVYNKTATTYTVLLKNIQYNETLSFQLIILLRNALFYKEVTIEIKNVTGGPGICGKRFKESYNIIETASLTVMQDICGHPKPYVEWKLEENTCFTGSSSSMLINNTLRKYRYSFTTRQMVRSHCGKKIMYTARNEFGKVEENSTIHISFKPSNITLTSSYKYNASCVYLTWYREDTGNCLLTYHLKFDDKDDVYNTSKTYFSLCHSPCASSASVWASYKGNAGYNISIILRSLTSRPDTTKMPSSRTDDCQYASKLAIGIVSTIVIGLIINIVIFVILKNKGFIIFPKNSKKTSQHSERRDDHNYEVTETTSSHYADLNIKSVEQSIYADLTKTSVSSKEYAEIELNDTERNMYANINT